ncbi:hypothetical protein [uncultured Aquimarina sp.]|uniref:hypothetical protein n=1 Tax=uncultured Aquimarina sp. TaxID=575652 RepID=UPI0026270A36|nr:hypothetical protein [uncultured Aquimarina sp.]
MTIEEKIEELTKRFELEMANLSGEISKKAEDIQEDSEILQDKGVGFTITDENGNAYNFEWKEVSFHVPIPHFSMLEQNISFDIPSITMKTKDISFDVPAVRMVDRQVAIKPVTTCDWETRRTLGIRHKYWACKITDKPVIISVPEPYMRTIDIKVDIPEVRMETQRIIFHVPSVTVEMKLVKFHSIVLTEINYQDIEDNMEDSESEINEGQHKIDLLTASFETEMNTLSIQLTNESFDKAENDIKALMKPYQDKYENGIRKLKDSIKILKNNNAVDQVIIEEANLKKLINEMNIFINPYKQALIDLNTSRENALNELKNNVQSV